MIECLGLLGSIFRFTGIKNILVFITLIIFMHTMRPSNNDGDIHSFISEDSVKGFLSKNKSFVPRSHKIINWHNYRLMRQEFFRRGLGEQGQPVSWVIRSAESLTSFNIYGVNDVLSDKISVNRSLQDVRHRKCMLKKYMESLPSVSIIIPFHNEHLNTLLRTVYSVINRSPPKLIKEIILVDDASTMNNLQKGVEESIAKNEPKLKYLKLSKRNGYITAKLQGAKEATGDVLVFLESHCEVNTNWLPPLLHLIALDYHTVTCPVIDRIDPLTFEYRKEPAYRIGFDWNLKIKMYPVNIHKNSLPEPYNNSIMAGGIFAISRLFFWELGGYDPGLYPWGGDQFELSFKIWQCGGRLLTVPCSRVGHIYYNVPKYFKYAHGHFIKRNYRRVADVWMDQYAQKVFKNSIYSQINPGDISEQKALRQRLKCKPFSWYVSKVAKHILHLGHLLD